MRTTLLALLMAFGVAASAEAGEVKVINKDTWFAEGPIWYQNKLFYVEYVSRRDGRQPHHRVRYQ